MRSGAAVERHQPQASAWHTSSASSLWTGEDGGSQMVAALSVWGDSGVAVGEGDDLSVKKSAAVGLLFLCLVFFLLLLHGVAPGSMSSSYESSEADELTSPGILQKQGGHDQSRSLYSAAVEPPHVSCHQRWQISHKSQLNTSVTLFLFACGGSSNPQPVQL